MAAVSLAPSSVRTVFQRILSSNTFQVVQPDGSSATTEYTHLSGNYQAISSAPHVIVQVRIRIIYTHNFIHQKMVEN